MILAGATPLVFQAADEAGAGAPDPTTQVKLAAAAGTVGALSLADAALARVAKEARPGKLVAELEATRARVALPCDAAGLGVTPEDEPRYVAAFWTASNAVAPAELRPRPSAASPRSPRPSPTARGARSSRASSPPRAGAFAEAERHCAAALAKDPGALRAHLAAGRLAAHARHNGDAEKHFRRAIELDPSDETAWRELAHLYRAMGSATQHDQLVREHEAILAAPLRE